MGDLLDAADRFHVGHGGHSNLTCKCGSQWWQAAVIIRADDHLIGGWAMNVECNECKTRIEL